MNTLEQKLENLFIDWKTNFGEHGKQKFIVDGVFDESLYHECSPKVLLINKEAYNLEDYGQNLIRYVKEKGLQKDRMWKNAQRLVNCIYYISSDRIPSYDEINKKVAESGKFMGCAVMNIKKYDGKETSNNDDLRKHFEYHRSFILKEIEILNPDMIICGNVFSFFRSSLLKFELLDEVPLFYKNENRIWVDYWHPACHAPTSMYYHLFAVLFQRFIYYYQNQYKFILPFLDISRVSTPPDHLQ